LKSGKRFYCLKIYLECKTVFFSCKNLLTILSCHVILYKVITASEGFCNIFSENRKKRTLRKGREATIVGKNDQKNNRKKPELISEYEDDYIEDDSIYEEYMEGSPKEKRVSKRKQRLAALSYEERIAAHRRAVALRTVCIIFAIVLIVAVLFIIGMKMTYSSYSVIRTEDWTEGTTVQYREFYNKILRFSKDGVVFYDNQKKDIWNETYEMQNPMIDICGQYIVIADENGSNVCVFDLDGKVNSFTVTKSVKKVQISEKGTLVLLLEQGDSHYIQYLDVEGNLIAEGQILFEQSGYPLDMALSDDGLKLAVSYLAAGSGSGVTNVVFYSFSDVGITATDNIVSQMQYTDTVIPTLHYANDSTMFAFGDNQLTIFSGSEAPQATAEIAVTEEIKSIFYSDKYAGMVFEDGSGYRMDIYNLQGKLVLSQNFDFDYDNIKLEKNQIIMYNSEEWCIYTLSGKQKLEPCALSETVSDIVALSANRFILVKTNKTEIVRLKF